jgi:hypothetical protein
MATLVQRWKSLSTRAKAGTIVGVIVVLAAIGSQSKPPATAPLSASGSPSPAILSIPPSEPAPTELSPSAEPSSAAPEVTVEPSIPLAFDPIKLTGKGTKIVRFEIPEGQAGIAVITGKSSSNFAVWTVDNTGQTTDLLVNEIGSYSGTRLFDDQIGSHTVAFKVESKGSWTITVKPVGLAKTWASTSGTSGKGDMVLQVQPFIDGLAVSRVTHRGESNFAVWSYSAGGRDLQVNEIGHFDGEVLWPSNTTLVVIEADGAWTISKPA